MAKKVTGEVLNQNYELQVKFNELYRQINQNNGYPFVFENLLSHLQDAVEGKFKNDEATTVKLVGNHEINTDITPNMPFDGAKIEKHGRAGKIVLDFSKINLYLSEKQKTGSIIGHDLRKELEGKKAMNACVLDYLLANPHLIPEDWKKDSKGNTRFIFFWGTIFRLTSDNLYVRCLCWYGGKWQSVYNWLGSRWGVNDPAAVSAS